MHSVHEDSDTDSTQSGESDTGSSCYSSNCEGAAVKAEFHRGAKADKQVGSTLKSNQAVKLPQEQWGKQKEKSGGSEPQPLADFIGAVKVNRGVTALSLCNGTNVCVI